MPLASLLLLSLLSVPVRTADARECALEPTDLESLVDDYDEHVDRVPDLVRSRFGDERIDVRLDTDGGERRFAVTTADDRRITAFDEGTAADPTLLVETAESTFRSVVGAEVHAAAFLDAYDGGAIDVSGAVKAVEVEAVEIGVTIVRVVSGLFGSLDDRTGPDDGCEERAGEDPWIGLERPDEFTTAPACRPPGSGR